jgi:hypothetical protein
MINADRAGRRKPKIKDQISKLWNHRLAMMTSLNLTFLLFDI